METKWISVKERLPKDSEAKLVSDGKSVACAHWFGKIYNPRTKQIEPGEWCNFRFLGNYISEPTHWMPLPEPPDARA